MNARSSKVVRSVNLRGIGMPQVLITEMTYRDFGSLAANAQVAYSLNGIFNPRTGVPHQPRYFDQFMNEEWYQKYTVYKVDVEVRFRNVTGSDVVAAVNADTASTFPTALTPTSLFLMGELPYLHSRTLSNPADGGDRHWWTFKASYRPSKLLGITKSKMYSEDNFSGTISANPATQPYFMVGAADNPQDDGLLAVDYEIYLKYYVKLYNNLRDVPVSDNT